MVNIKVYEASADGIGKELEEFLNDKATKINEYYDVSGEYSFIDWYGTEHTVITRFYMDSKDELKEICEDPLQDYEAYGAQKVTWVNLIIEKRVEYASGVTISYPIVEITAEQ